MVASTIMVERFCSIVQLVCRASNLKSRVIILLDQHKPFQGVGFLERSFTEQTEDQFPSVALRCGYFQVSPTVFYRTRLGYDLPQDPEDPKYLCRGH